VALLVRALERVGIASIATREPGGSPGAEAIRNLLLQGDTERWDAVGEALLLYAARRDHVARLVQPALGAGKWVVCDRFTDSTAAYQGYGRGLPLADLASLRRVALGEFRPDLTVILDLSVTEGLLRAASRAGPTLDDRFERLKDDFHQRLRDGFREIAKAEPERCVLIDASGDVAAVHRAIVTAVNARLGVALE
jgi:dTMP kinase